jgi:hypothetical protein
LIFGEQIEPGRLVSGVVFAQVRRCHLRVAVYDGTLWVGWAERVSHPYVGTCPTQTKPLQTKRVEHR